MDFQFDLVRVNWPLVVLTREAKVAELNFAAISIFGEGLKGRSLLEFITGLEKPVLPFSDDLKNLVVPVAIPLLSGPTTKFRAHISPSGQATFFLVLLLEENSGELVAHPQVQKQKLDVALHLTESIAADFNNVLTSILGHTSLILKKIGRKDPAYYSVSEIEKAAAKAAEITTDLASFSRQTSEPQSKAYSNLNEMVRRIVNTFELTSSDRMVWTLDTLPDLCSVKVDEAKVQQAFVKIFENAVQSVAGQGGIICIRTYNFECDEPHECGLARLSPGTYACVEIKDNGPGIHPSVLPRIFEPFFTTKDSQKHKGLGLTWVYGVVANHSGSVMVTTRLGTTVKVYLPGQKLLMPETALNEENLNGSETILIVDDEELIVAMASTVLRSYGYNIITANSATEALDIFRECSDTIDLVVSDLVMPDLNGRDLIFQLKRINPKVATVCMTGFVRVLDQESEAGTYLKKPFTSYKLLTTVKKALEPKRSFLIKIEPPASLPSGIEARRV